MKALMTPSRVGATVYGLLLLIGLLAWSEPAAAQTPDETTQASVQAGAESPPSSDDAPAAPMRKSRLRWFLESSGWIGAIILALSINFVATVIRLFNELRLPTAMPPEVVQQCDVLLAKRDYQGIYDLVKGIETPFTRLLTAGMAEISTGLDAARDAMECVAECVSVEMERQISMLAVLGSLGPMIGLLGTLKGMISSFSVIALSDTQLKASEVAGGISEALLLTFQGVALSVPAIYFFAVFRSRVAGISAEVFLRADEFMRRVAASAKARQAA